MYSIADHWLADLLVTSEDGTTQLLIETKKAAATGMVDMARTIRKQVAASIPNSFFLFISTQRFWLWSPAAVEPVYEGNTDALLGRYVNLKKTPLHTLSGRGFLLLVYSWLGSVIFKPAQTLLEMPGQKWLVTSGLQPLIYKGYIHLEASAS